MNNYSPADQSYYLVMQNFKSGRQGYVDLDVTLEHVIQGILEGQYNKIAWIAEFNPVEGWSKPVTEDIAQIIFARHSDEPFSNHVADFLEKHLSDGIAVQLRRAA